MRVFAIRGAITARENTAEAIDAAGSELIGAIVARNALNESDIITILISSTADLDAMYPAKAVRMAGMRSTPLFSCLEPSIEHALTKCIRMLVLINAEDTFEPHHVYLGEASVLRPDLAEKE